MTGAVQNRTPWGLVTFLLLLHMLNQIDRQLVASFASDIMRDLELDRAQFALIAGLEDLPEHIKQQIDGLYTRHSIEASFGASMPIEQRHALKAQYPDAEHPVVITHPETGEKVLYVSAYLAAQRWRCCRAACGIG